MSILFINACVRENSRTLVLAKNILSNMPCEVVEVNLNIFYYYLAKNKAYLLLEIGFVSNLDKGRLRSALF
mgnify:CR=1 FL=1